MSSPRPSILFVNQHYWPDVAATGQHLTDLAEYLAVCGFDVTVLCSRGKYAGGGTLETVARETRNRVEIVRLRGTGFGRAHSAGRLSDYATFLSRVTARMLLGRRYDMVVFLTTPSLLGVAGLVGRYLRRQPYAIWSMDVHPDVEERLGMVPRGGIGRVFRGLGNASYRRADFVVSLGECMRQVLYRKGVTEERIRGIPVWSPGDDVRPIAKLANPLARDLGLEGRFVVMYSGNAGLAHRFDEVLDGIERLREDDDIEWLFVGGGPRKREILERTTGRGRFRYLDYWPRETLGYSLSLGDVHLITMREDMAGLIVPGKLYGIMAAGRPAVFVGPRRSDTARTIDRVGMGVVIDPTEPDATERFVEAIRRIRDEPEERRAMGRRARAAYEAEYERNVCCAEWGRVLAERLEVPFPPGRYPAAIGVVEESLTVHRSRSR